MTSSPSSTTSTNTMCRQITVTFSDESALDTLSVDLRDKAEEVVLGLYWLSYSSITLNCDLVTKDVTVSQVVYRPNLERYEANVANYHRYRQMLLDQGLAGKYVTVDNNGTALIWETVDDAMNNVYNKDTAVIKIGCERDEWPERVM